MEKQSKERTRLQKIFVDIFAGTIAGINVTLVGHPFDTLKIRLQSQPRKNPIYSGVVDCFKKTIQWEGFSGLYKGVSSPIAGQMFFRALLFLSYGEAKRIKSENGKKELKKSDYFICAGGAWGIATLAECPIDFFKTQTQIQIIKSKTIPNYVPEYNSPYDCFKKVISLNGYKGAFQGFSIHLLRNIFAGSAHIGIYDNTRLLIAQKMNKSVKDIGLFNMCLCGGLGGWCFWFFFYPLDVLKSSMQSQSPDISKRKYASVYEARRNIYKEEGIKGFYRGFTPCMMRALPANIALLVTSSWLTEHL